MKKSAATIKRSKRYLRSLLVSGLTLSNLLPFAAPILAAGTSGGTSISNTATATFDDPNTPGNTVTVTSNTVSIRVAEVAGITVTNAGFTDVNGASITTDDVLYYDFQVTNTGNDTTGIYLPAPTVTGATVTRYDIINPATGAVIATIPLTGGLTSGLTFTPVDDGILAPDESYTVRVTVTATATNVGDNVAVTLGNGTGSVTTSTPAAAQVRTSDAPETTTGEVAGTPTNGEQQATATRTVQIGTAPRFQAFAAILKTAAAPILNNVTTSQDDVIRYGLQLRVDSAAPAGTTGFTVTDLQPVQSVNFSPNRSGTNATPQNVVLVSDAIPANTRLAIPSDAGYTAPAAPTDGSGVNWTVWYSYSDVTVNVAANTALEDTWTDQAPSDATQAALVKRIGFVKSSSVARGVTTTPGSFSVVTNGVTTGGSIYNVAQVLGQSSPGANQPLVYDESGDQNPSNFDGATPNITSNLTQAQFNDPATINSGDNTPVTGIVVGTPPTAGIDPGNNNGTGPAGEVTATTIGAPLTAGLLNGPNNAPGALGPISNQDDFTNRNIDGVTGNQSSASTAVTLNPNPIAFANSVASSNTIQNVVIRPISAAEALAIQPGANYVGTAIPDLTAVTITATVRIPASGGAAAFDRVDTAVYTYNAGTGLFALTSSTSGPGNTDTTPKPILFANFTGGAVVNYTTTVDLPATATSLQAYSIPVVAYIEGDGLGQPGYGVYNPGGTGLNADQSPNITIDRLYTGFMQVDKFVRVLTAGGVERQAFTTTPNVAINPTDILEYEIRYRNISSPAAGSGSVTLNATQFRVVEDGLTSPNNWAGVTNHVLTQATGSAGSVSFYNGAFTSATNPGTAVAESTSVTGYVNTVGTVAPSTTPGTFRFQRSVR